MTATTHAGSVNTAVATFENYSEGSLGTLGFTDPVSGIAFSGATASSHNYIIEGTTTAQPGMPSMTPGHYLKSNGLSPGDGISLSPNTGFTLTLPVDALTVSLDFGYVGPGSLTVDAFDDSGLLVATQTRTPGSGSFQEDHALVQSLNGDIRKVVLSSTLTGTGYDNIRYTYVPEPVTLIPAAVVATISLGRTTRRRRTASLHETRSR